MSLKEKLLRRIDDDINNLLTHPQLMSSTLEGVEEAFLFLLDYRELITQNGNQVKRYQDRPFYLKYREILIKHFETSAVLASNHLKRMHQSEKESTNALITFLTEVKNAVMI